MRPLTDAEMFGTEEAKPLTDAEMFGAPEIKPLTDSEMFSAPEGEKVSKQEQFAIRTVPDAARSELRAPKPLEGVTRALKGMAGVPVAAVRGLVNESANTFDQAANVLEMAGDATGLQSLQGQADIIRNYGKVAMPDQPAAVNVSPAEKLAEDIAQGAGSMAKAYAAGIAAGPAAAGVLFGTQQAGSLYKELEDKNMTTGQKLLVALPGGLQEGLLEYVGLHKFLEGRGATRLARALYGAGVEATQEASQQAVEENLMAVAGQRDKKLGEIAKDILYSGLIGGIVGAPSAIIHSKLKEAGAKEIFQAAGLDNQQSEQALGKLAVKIQDEAKNVPQPVTPDVSKEQTQIQAGVQEQDVRQQRYVATVDKAIADGLTRDQANDLAVGMLNNSAVTPQDEAVYVAHFKNALVNKLPVDQAVQYADMKIRNAKIAQEQQQPAPVQVPAGFQVVQEGKTSPEEFYLKDIENLAKKYENDPKYQNYKGDDRFFARIADDHFGELDPETQRWLEFKAPGYDFESAENPKYEGFANADEFSSGKGNVHAGQITLLRENVFQSKQPAPVQVPEGFVVESVVKGPGAASPTVENTDRIPLDNMPSQINEDGKGIIGNRSDTTNFVAPMTTRANPPQSSNITIQQQDQNVNSKELTALSNIKNIKQAIPHLEAIGRRVMSEGKQSFEAWKSRMKSILGDMWNSFKSAMAAVYSRVSKWWEAQGRMGIVAPGFETPGGKRKKLSSLIRKLGGLDPKKLAKDYNLKDLKGDGLLNVMRKDGWALDEIVDRLQAEGVIIPEDVNPSDWVIEELKRQAGMKVEKSSDRKNDELYNKAAERQYENEKLIANKEIEKYGYSNAEIIEAERDLEADFEADVGREGVQEEAVSPAIYFSDEELALLKQADLPLPAPIANRISGTRTEGTPDLIPGVSMTQPGNAPPIGRGGIQAPAMSEEEYGKTKRKGIFWLTRETFRRNIESMFPKNVADRILAYASNPVMKNEYERISWLNKVRTDTAALLKNLGIGLYDKLDKPIEFEDEAGNKFKITTLDSAIQAYGEKVIDLKTLQNGTKKWHEVVQASEYFRDLYNKIIEKWNTSLRNFGYQPVPRRKDYFRHFRAMGGILDQFGFIFKGGDLPSAIAGLTEWFKPGRPFTTAQLKRMGVRTDYSAIKGFDNYLNSVSQQIYHTDSVQRIRMLEAYMRVVDPEGTKLSAFNNYLREYGNLLAGKTSTIDRSIENAFLGRTALQTMNWLRQRVSANMISANIGASLTNLIPLFTQLPTIVSPAALAKGLHEGAISPIKADFATIDGIKSSFLTRRFPVKEIFKTRGEKVGNALGFFFETIDAYTSVATTAAIYYNNLAKGINQEEAMRQADIEAGKLITDRSFGQLPNLFRSKLLGPITQFQIEVNNMASWIGKDLKVAHGGDRKKHAAALALFFMLSFMFNSIFEKLTGRRPTIDPIHATLILMGLDDQAYKSKEGVKTLKPFSARAGTAAVDMIENLPFGNTLMKFFGGGKGGRLPIEAAIPKGFTVKELSKPVFNLATPMAGGQIRKSLDGITAYATGGKFNSFGGYLDYQLGADAKKPKFTVEQTPANLARMAVFGPSASAEAKKYYAGR